MTLSRRELLAATGGVVLAGSLAGRTGTAFAATSKPTSALISIATWRSPNPNSEFA